MLTEDMEAAVRALEDQTLDGLRAEWRRRWGPPPKLRSAPLLRHIIAWRIQAAHFGGLDLATKRALNRASSTPPVSLQPGVRLVREYRGIEHQVEVVEGGFRYRGDTYASLSEIARAITGVRWNGLRFFGLRNGGSP